MFARQHLRVLPPKFTRLTFKRGYIVSAQFMPDAHSVLYSASWDGAPIELYEQRLGSPEARSVGLPPQTQILSVSSAGQLAVLLNQRVAGPFQYAGTLAEVASSGSAPREIAENISAADWSPDGKQLAIVRYAPGSEILEYPIGKQIYKTSGWVGDPHISPDGRQIAFVDHEDGSDDGGSIAMIDTSGAGNKKTAYLALVQPARTGVATATKFISPPRSPVPRAP